MTPVLVTTIQAMVVPTATMSAMVVLTAMFSATVPERWFVWGAARATAPV